jgi:hypothetical protein
VRILLTAFEPYDQWSSNSSWETIVELLRVRGTIPNVITRRYPVSLTRFQERLEVDLARGFDSIIHLGQAPGISQIHLEAIAINVAGVTEAEGADFGDLVVGGPVGYRSKFPLGIWASYLRQSGIPARVSYHAGTYLCNAGDAWQDRTSGVYPPSAERSAGTGKWTQPCVDASGYHGQSRGAAAGSHARCAGGTSLGLRRRNPCRRSVSADRYLPKVNASQPLQE